MIWAFSHVYGGVSDTGKAVNLPGMKYMLSQPTELAQNFIKTLRNSTAARVGVLAVVAAAAAIIGPPGLAVGPTQSHTHTPALATGAAMEARVVLSTIPISFDIMPTPSGLIQDHRSYPERRVGELRFPEGAISVPWSDWQGTDDQPVEVLATAIPSRGGSISTPSRDDTPQLMSAALGGPDFVASDMLDLGNFRSVILFDRTAADLQGDAEDTLDRVAASLRGNNIRVQLRAFGGGMADRTHTARRLALRRALSVRNYLMDQGIDQERITVRAMGGASDGGPTDRVDIVMAGQ